MRRANTYAVHSLVSGAVAALFLICIFIFPAMYLKNMTEDIDVLAADAIRAVQNEDYASARQDVIRIQERFLLAHQPLKLFLNHEDIDELEVLISIAVSVSEIEDGAELLNSLERIRSCADYLENIETFSLYNLF